MEYEIKEEGLSTCSRCGEENSMVVEVSYLLLDMKIFRGLNVSVNIPSLSLRCSKCQDVVFAPGVGPDPFDYLRKLKEGLDKIT